MSQLAKKVWIKTYGCQMNERDSEALQSMLSKLGFIIVGEGEEDIAILNTCSIRKLAELKALGKAGRLLKKKRRRPDYKVGIIGCMASRKEGFLSEKLPGIDFIVPPQGLSRVPQVVESLFAREQKQTIVIPTAFDFTCYEAARLFPQASVSVPIQTGCNMACSYCIVPQTRGNQQNRSIDSILREVNSVTQEGGAREIVLLGQIVNAYRDPQSSKDFVDLLALIHAIDAVRRIRFLSPHPAFFTKRLVRAFEALPKLCPALHLPVQSGSDAILKGMRRVYTRQKIRDLAQSLRCIHPKMSISTDLIVGYPGESEADFQATVDLFNEVKFDMAYVFKYSARPFTLAAQQEEGSLQVPEEVKEYRNQYLLKMLAACSRAYNEQFLGEMQEVLIEGKAHRGQDRLFGKNVYNKKVIVTGPEKWINTFKQVRIERAGACVLEGFVVE